MAPSSRDVTEAELAILRVLWDTPEPSVREITDRLYPDGGNSEFATVQKLCDRLEAKGLVEADRDRRPKVLRAKIDRSSLSVRKLRAVAEELYSGSLTPLVSQLLRGGTFSAEEIHQLRDQIERLALESTPRDASDPEPEPGDKR